MCRPRVDSIIDEYVFCKSQAVFRVYSELLNFDQSLRVF
jgi:hypothetical protein